MNCSDASANTLGPSQPSRKIRIQTKLIAVFLLLSIFPLSIIGIFSYNKSSEAIKSKISTYSAQVMNQLSKNIQFEIRKFEEISNEIAFSETVQQGLKRYKDENNLEKLNIYRQVFNLLSSKFTLMSAVKYALVVTNTKVIMPYGEATAFRSEDLDTIYNIAAEKKGSLVWLLYNKNLLITKAINYAPSGEQLGVLIMVVDHVYISKIYESIDIGQNADIFIIDSNGMVISGRNPAIEAGVAYKHKSLTEKILELKRDGKTVFPLALDKANYLVAFSQIGNHNWYVVGTIPFAYLNAEANNIGTSIAVAGLTLLVIALVLSYIMSKNIAGPIKKLCEKASLIAAGNLTVDKLKVNTRDELRELVDSFNKMVDDLKKTILDVVGLSKTVRSTSEDIKSVTELLSSVAQTQIGTIDNLMRKMSLSGSNPEFITLSEGIKRGASEVYAGSSEIATATVELADYARELENTVEQFKVDGTEK